MNICRLNVSSKMCVNFAPACITHRALQRLKYRTLVLSPLSPLIAAERRCIPAARR